MVYYPGYLREFFGTRKVWAIDGSLLPWIPGCVHVATCTVEDGESAGNLYDRWTTPLRWMVYRGFTLSIDHFHELYMLLMILFFRILSYSDPIVTIV